jgi:hypothetical protein
MAEYTTRAVTTTRYEFCVPALWHEGACWVEVQKAIAAATRELRDKGLLAADREPSDDQIRIRPSDDEIVVYYEHAVAS